MTGPCMHCGHRNEVGAGYCSSCGTALAAVDPLMEITEAVAGDSGVGIHVDRSGFGAQDGLFVVLEGPKAGARYSLDDDVVTVGRHPGSTIFLDDITVSRRHAEVHRRSPSYRVRDVGSLNGTYVNRTRVDDVELVDGDEIQIGRYKLVFVRGADG